ncbi:MAG: hypothetical protein JJ913_07945 [Rhizobiaceae bacterium]|nr:hypothetical protein [Rhizobiaceae bacterium]
MRRLVPLLATAWMTMSAAANPVAADTIDLRLKFIAPDGAPLAALPVRVATGTEDIVRQPGSGERGETDESGGWARQIETTIEQRKITLDSWFVRHPSNLLRIAVEMELVGRQALYVIELDQVRDGTVGAMSAWIAGNDGRFDVPLTFHKDTHAWSFPDDAAGMLMSSIGADLREFELLGSAEAGWTATVTIEKQSFTVR